MKCDYCKKEAVSVREWRLCERCSAKLRRRKVPKVSIDEAAFAKLLKYLDDEIATLQLVEDLYSGVAKRLRQHLSVSRRHSAFFGGQWVAMRTDMIIRLSRLYDRENISTGCTLTRCLEAIRDHPEWFRKEAVERRLNPAYRQSNPDYMDRNTPAAEDLVSWLKKVADARDPLLHLRNKRFAHTDLKTFLSGDTRKMLSKHEEVQALIALAREAWNYCSMVWHASTSTGKLLTGTNLDLLFRDLRRGIKVEGLRSRRHSARPWPILHNPTAARPPNAGTSSSPTTRP